MITGIKHVAVAVKDVEKALAVYQRFLGVGSVNVKELSKAQTREAHFVLGGLEFQLCQSLPADGRFNNYIDAHNGEGLHHICFTVEDIDGVLKDAVAKGATLRPCRACGVVGSHKHSEGWVAFLDDEVTGMEVEFMQVYKHGEGPESQKREM